MLKGTTLRNGAAELRFSQPISIIISCEVKTVSLRTCISSALMTIHLSGTLQSQSLYMCIEDLLSLSEHQKWFFFNEKKRRFRNITRVKSIYSGRLYVES